jgi:uncharacterized protein YjbI with pentapeptide repeats
MVRKLASYVRQQHIGLLALFVALGGSAYAAATINSQKVVDNSLTGADVKGRNASRGKPFTQGTLTGQDVRGSAAAPGRPAVDGSLTGADIGDKSLGGADLGDQSIGGAQIADGSIGGGKIADGSIGGGKIADGSVNGGTVFDKSLSAVDIADGSLTGGQIADGSIGGGKIAGNSVTGANIDESSLDTVPRAGDSATVGGLAPGAFGTAVRSAAQDSSECAVPDTNIECASVTVKVPAGRLYDAIVWSSISAFHTAAGVKSLKFCPTARPPAATAVCLTSTQGFEDGINLQQNFSESGVAFGTTSMLGQHLGPGTWIFSTRVRLDFGGGVLGSNSAQQVHTTVLLYDATVPELPVDPPGGSSGTSGSTSSGATSGTSGSTSSGASSGTSGSTSSGASSGT